MDCSNRYFGGAGDGFIGGVGCFNCDFDGGGDGCGNGGFDGSRRTSACIDVRGGCGGGINVRIGFRGG